MKNVIALCLALVFLIALCAMLTGCTTTVQTTTDTKGHVATTKTTEPPQGLMTAIGTAIGGAIDTAIQGILPIPNS